MIPILIGAVLMLATAAASAWTLWDARRDARRQAVQASDNLVLSLERDVDRNIEIYDLSLRAAQRGVVLPELSSASPDARNSILFDGAASAAFFSKILITDEAGQVIYDADSATPRPINLAGRDYFRQHREQPEAGLVIGLVQKGQSSGRSSLVLSRRLDGPGGLFMGVVAGGITIDYFNDLFAQLRLGEADSVALFTRDGRLVARRPARPEEFGRQVDRVWVTGHEDAAAAGSYEVAHSMDGVERIYSYHQVGKLPLVLTVGTATAEVYAAWRQKAWTIGCALCAFALLSGLLALAFRREARRRGLAEARAAEADAKFGVQFDHLADGALLLRAGAEGRFACEAVNPAAATLLGLPHRPGPRRLDELWPPARLPALEAGLRDCLLTRRPAGCDVPSGATGHHRAAMLPVSDSLVLLTLREAPAGRPAAVPASPGGRVLLLAAEPDDLASALGAAGLDVVVARHPEAALRILGSDQPLDAMVSGGELAVEAEALRPGLPVLAIEGDAALAERLRHLPRPVPARRHPAPAGAA